MGLLLIFGFGPEKHGKDFSVSEEAMVVDMATPSDPDLDPTRYNPSRVG